MERKYYVYSGSDVDLDAFATYDEAFEFAGEVADAMGQPCHIMERVLTVEPSDESLAEWAMPLEELYGLTPGRDFPGTL